MTHDNNMPETSELKLQLDGYRLATAEIIYHIPDHPGLLQTYIWQEFDLLPKYPELQKFLDFWVRELDGPLHSVRITNCDIITPGHARFADTLMTLH